VKPSVSTRWYSSGTPNDGLKFQRKMKTAARQRGPLRSPARKLLSVATTVARSLGRSTSRVVSGS
jgi:hypothetical protein